jgi:uncharacterized protein YktB (UPF0637 family)
LKRLPTLGFTPADFEVFRVEGFNQRMAQIYEHVRPKLIRLGGELAPELARKLHLEFFPHVAKHARRTVNPPAETWCAFGPSPKGYKRYGYLALCISSVGLHARLVVKPEADHRPQMADGLRSKADELVRSFKSVGLSRYDKWNFRDLPQSIAGGRELWSELADALDKKTGAIDVGFGWKGKAALRLGRAELLDAYRELEPLYRICRSVS